MEESWPQGTKELDIKGLQKGLKRIDHRDLHTAPGRCCAQGDPAGYNL